jgi:hypothetical protein
VIEVVQVQRPASVFACENKEYHVEAGVVLSKLEGSSSSREQPVDRAFSARSNIAKGTERVPPRKHAVASKMIGEMNGVKWLTRGASPWNPNS